MKDRLRIAALTTGFAVLMVIIPLVILFLVTLFWWLVLGIFFGWKWSDLVFWMQAHLWMCIVAALLAAPFYFIKWYGSPVLRTVARVCNKGADVLDEIINSSKKPPPKDTHTTIDTSGY